MFNQNPVNIEHVQSVKRRHEDMLLSKPSVVGVGISYIQDEAGNYTDQPCIVVTVKNGGGQGRLRSVFNSDIPSELEGVAVVVQSVGPIIGLNN